jgi:antitoxin MazE
VITRASKPRTPRPDAPYPTGGGDRTPDRELDGALRELRRQLDRILQRLGEGTAADEIAEATATPYAAGPPIPARIVSIGNSQGVRIPKPLLESTGLSGEVELTAADDCIVIRRAPRARPGWAAAFAEMAERGDDRLLDEEPFGGTVWDEEEWEW